jgi:DNA repair photolyase
LAKFRNPVGMLTKNRLVTRDIDIFRQLAEHNAVAINVSVTTLDRKLQRILEPRTSPPQARLDAVAQLRDAGIPVGVMVAPIIPGITDHEVPKIVEACGKAGAQFAGYVMLRLPGRSRRCSSAGWMNTSRPQEKGARSRTRYARRKALRLPWSKRQEGEGVFASRSARCSKSRAGAPESASARSSRPRHSAGR